jgi:predicted membrane channel-forming protein YqfA (hemolysin III family)
VAGFTLLDAIWSVLVLSAMILLVWMVITLFADIVRREDLSGLRKVIWTLVLIVVPLFGSLVYLLARPVTEQDRRELAERQRLTERLYGYSPSEELEKLSRLREAGTITDDEFTSLKARIAAA